MRAEAPTLRGARRDPARAPRTPPRPRTSTPLLASELTVLRAKGVRGARRRARAAGRRRRSRRTSRTARCASASRARSRCSTCTTRAASPRSRRSPMAPATSHLMVPHLELGRARAARAASGSPRAASSSTVAQPRAVLHRRARRSRRRRCRAGRSSPRPAAASPGVLAVEPANRGRARAALPGDVPPAQCPRRRMMRGCCGLLVVGLGCRLLRQLAERRLEPRAAAVAVHDVELDDGARLDQRDGVAQRLARADLGAVDRDHDVALDERPLFAPG